MDALPRAWKMNLWLDSKRERIMPTHQISEFKLIDDQGNEYTIFEYQDGMEKPSLKWMKIGPSWFRLSDGTPVNKIDDDTFKIAATDSVLTRAR
jgi:hypothetical protein